jgi:hypothetical protein
MRYAEVTREAPLIVGFFIFLAHEHTCVYWILSVLAVCACENANCFLEVCSSFA